jgi:hypothetical protein
MKAQISFCIFVLACPIAPGQDGSLWASVPSSREARTLEAIRVLSAPTEDAVRVILPVHAALVPLKAPARVFSTDIDMPLEGVNKERTVADQTLSEIPVTARWPGSDDRIVEAHPATSGSTKPSLRNPWEMRIRPRAAEKDAIFLCGGVISGGAGGPVAIVNGRVVKPGDSMDDFEVAKVTASAVVLEKDASLYVVPRGRRTTIVMAAR